MTTCPKDCSPILPENSNDASKPSADLKRSAPSDTQAVHAKMPNTRHKRRKLEAEPANTQQDQVARLSRPDKYVRGRRGHLKFMTEMPIDTLHEIFRQLEPLDLLYLSWADKGLRVLVMEKAARYIWAEAYERLYASDHPPPRCPEDVNFAQYTRFLYHKKCIVCEIKNGSHASWEMRLRVCYECVESSERFTRASYRQEGEGHLLLHVKKKTFIETGKPLCDWREIRKRREGTQDFNVWQQRCLNDRRADLHRRRSERVSAILEKLNEIGWSEAYIKEIYRGEPPDNLPGFRRVGKLTRKDWAEIEPKLVEILSQRKEVYLAECLDTRWVRFQTKFQVWSRRQETFPSDLWPKAMDLAIFEPFRTVIFESETAEIELGEDDIDRVAKEWAQWRDSRLFSLLPEKLQTRYQADKTSLPPLAIFRFGTLDSNNASLTGARRVRQYFLELAIPQYLLTPDQRKINETILKCNYLKIYPWAWLFPYIRFATAGSEIAIKVLEFLEMDPYTTTLTQILEYKQRFNCRYKKSYHSPYCCDAMIEHSLKEHYDEIKQGTPLADIWTPADN